MQSVQALSASSLRNVLDGSSTTAVPFEAAVIWRKFLLTHLRLAGSWVTAGGCLGALSCQLPRKDPHRAVYNSGFAALLRLGPQPCCATTQAIEDEGRGCPSAELGNWRQALGRPAALPLGSAHHATGFEGGFKESPRKKASWTLSAL